MNEITEKGKKAVPSYVYGLLLVAECMMWGYSNAYSKLAFHAISPMWVLVLRYFFSAILFAVFFGRRIKREFKREQLKACLLVSIVTAAAFILGFVALDNTSATNCAFLMSLAVVFVPLLGTFILRTRFRPKQILPVVIAAAGLFFICGGRLSSLVLGDLLAIVCSVASALMIIFSSKYLKGIDTFVLCFSQCVVCFAVSLPLAFILEPVPDFLHLEPIAWKLVAMVTIGCTFLAYYFQNAGLSHVSATFGALVFCTEPIFTAISAFFILGERLSLTSSIGAALILAGVTLASIFEGQDSKPDAAQKPAEADGA